MAITRNRFSALVILLAGITALLRPVTAADDEKEWTLATTLYADKKAAKVGDVLTVIIEEEAEAAKDAKSSSSKSSSLGGSASFVHPNIDSKSTPWTNAVLPAYTLDTTRSFDGSGSLANSETLKSKITVCVTDVLPNGNLIVEGKRSVIIQDESMQVILTGTVRPRDVTRDNTVSSTLIADTSIKYKSSGPMVKSQKLGLFMRLWNWVNPF